MSDKTRGDNLADLADSIRELTEPRNHAEFLEVTVTEALPSKNGRRRAKRTRRRKMHTVTLPCLLIALHDAAAPGAGESGSVTGGFESRPSAELEPLAVLGEIIEDANFWANTFDLNRPTLAKTISALVGAPHDDAQLARIASQAARWVRRARLATGFDPSPFTLGAPCPHCGRRNSLVITGDLNAGRCSRCGVDWDENTIGILANMLTTSATVETLALAPCTTERCQRFGEHDQHAPCWMTDCTKNGPHDEHADRRGRTWRDTCDLKSDFPTEGESTAWTA